MRVCGRVVEKNRKLFFLYLRLADGKFDYSLLLL